MSKRKKGARAFLDSIPASALIDTITVVIGSGGSGGVPMWPTAGSPGALWKKPKFPPGTVVTCVMGPGGSGGATGH